MNYEEAIERFESLGGFCDFCNEKCEGDCEKCFDMEDRILEALEKQSNIVHCKDCKNWSYPHYVEGFNKNAPIGLCELTKWLCGEQGYCMYGSEVE